jgi:hypothetical protein
VKDIDQNRFEQELIYFIDKLDITEEKIRLKTHCDYFIADISKQMPMPTVKKLGFHIARDRPRNKYHGFESKRCPHPTIGSGHERRT